MKKTIILVITLLVLTTAFGQQIIDSTRVALASPDGNYAISFYQKRNADNTRTMFYTVDFKSQPVIHESEMDIQLDKNRSERATDLKVDNYARWCENLMVTKIRSSSSDATWKPVYGERSEIRDHYNAVTIELVKEDNPIYLVHVEIRAYNEGVALRYFFPENSKGTYYRV